MTGHNIREIKPGANHQRLLVGPHQMDSSVIYVCQEGRMNHRLAQKGQGTIEYALLTSLVALVVVGSLALMGRQLTSIYAGMVEAIALRCNGAGQQTFRSFAGTGGLPPETNASLSAFPTEGKLTQGYSICHHAMDVANEEGTPIKAVANGVVVFAGQSNEGYGNLVVVDHGNFQTLYAHLKSFSVSEGTFTDGDGPSVQAGQMLGTMGNTGFSTGPHLHFEIRWGSDLGNPLELLPH
jgi:murein DD-endopeptidase MepM/ murein hydrolase activator NlpD